MMKKFIAGFLIAVSVATSAVAAASSLCSQIGLAAENTMRARQMGMAMSKVMELSQGNSLIEEIILDAYKEPRFSSEEAKKRAIEDFRNKWEFGCYKSQGKSPI